MKNRQIHHRAIHAESFRLVHSGNDYFKTLEQMIDSAVFEIHFQTYIFLDDDTGKHIAKALIRAASRGVKVYLLIDAYGSGDLSEKMVYALRMAEIEVRWYGKLFSGLNFHIGRRLHRKIVLVDRQDALIGGINISNNYNQVEGKTPWLDYAVLIEGASTHQFYQLCIERWFKPMKKRALRKAMKEDAHRALKKSGQYSSARIIVNENDYLRRRNSINVVIETPAGSGIKYKYDEEGDFFSLDKMMPLGICFPVDFGFIPHTKGGDDDPLDALVISDFHVSTGTVIECRVIGALLAQQKESGERMFRNDRFVCVPVKSLRYTNVKKLQDINETFVRAIVTFFRTYNELQHKTFKLVGIKNATTAIKLIRQGMMKK